MSREIIRHLDSYRGFRGDSLVFNHIGKDLVLELSRSLQADRIEQAFEINGETYWKEINPWRDRETL